METGVKSNEALSFEKLQPKVIRSKKIKKHYLTKWSNSEYTTLIAMVQNYGENWNQISTFIPNKTPFQCLQKFKNSQRSAKKGNWTNKEDGLLLNWVKKNGATKWTECSKLIRGRCGKQCRERWVNILNPKVKKGNWSNEEQNKIFENLSLFYTSWSSMSKILPGRTENSIKNYFYSSIRRIKSNPVIKIFKDIYIDRIKTIDDYLKQKDVFESEILKFNKLSQSICFYLLDSDNKEKGFLNFLVSLLLYKHNTDKIFKKNKSTNNSKQSEENLNQVPTLYIPQEKHCGELFQEKQHQNNLETPSSTNNRTYVMEVINKFLKENILEDQRELLTFFENMFYNNQNVAFRNENGNIKVDVPICWDCLKHRCNSH
jgi:hypothetical protein